MKRIVLAILALALVGCATGGAMNPQTAEEGKPRTPSLIEEMGQGGGGY